MRLSGLFKNSITETTTYSTLRPRACFHCHREEEQDPQETSKRLPVQQTIRQCKRGERTRLTNEPPGITSLVYLHPRIRDVRCIAEEWKPHIFDMQIVKRFIKRAVELMSLVEKGKRRFGDILNKNRCKHTVV